MLHMVIQMKSCRNPLQNPAVCMFPTIRSDASIHFLEAFFGQDGSPRGNSLRLAPRAYKLKSEADGDHRIVPDEVFLEFVEDLGKSPRISLASAWPMSTDDLRWTWVSTGCC